MNTLLDNSDPGVKAPEKYLEALVGDGRKFATPEEMARGKWESDLHIKALEQKLDQKDADYARLDADYKARASLEEMIDKVGLQKQPDSTPPTTPQTTQPQIDQNQLRTLVNQTLRETREQDQQTANFNMVKNKLVERYGKDYQSKLTEQMQELGLSQSSVDNLAHNMPQVLIKTLGLEQQTTEPFRAPVRSNQNFQPTGEKKRTWSYYEQMRKENPDLYKDSKTVNQMHEDAIALGEAFQDGNFSR